MSCHHELEIYCVKPTNTNEICHERNDVLAFVCGATVIHVQAQISDPRWHFLFKKPVQVQPSKK